ncbi:DUF3413 domain-containing protein [Psychromonas hadalis]|uniref:DUF3413 domain-containing protein n=1 Tax=Psychromonas hadalis TaxID=211669 RepID=UPI0003B614F5|nr:DUF3413 domain-containing protein [Psychromonas hadalis]
MNFKKKIHAYGWFVLCNSLLAMLISLRYFSFLPELPSSFLPWIFLISSTFSQMSLLVAIFSVLFIPLLFLPKLPRNILLATIASSGIALLFIDTAVFALYRFHINVVVLDLVLAGQVVTFPLSVWAMVVFGVIVALVCEFLLIRWLESEPRLVKKKLGRKFTSLVVITALLSNGIHIWASAYVYQPITVLKQYLPVFYPMTANGLMRKNGWVDEEGIARQKAMQIKVKSNLNYPLNSIQTTLTDKPKDILIIMIDAWRQDAFSPQITPNMWEIAKSKNAAILKNHISTGNATRAGVFGFFNGIPSSYWHSFLANNQPSLLIEQLQALDYELGIFTAARLEKPEFNKTIFSNVKNLRMGSDGERAYQLDEDLTQDWMTWNRERDSSKPAFSFLFYDSVHGFDFPDDYPHKFTPMWSKVNHFELNNETDPSLYFNLYKNSVNYVDSVVKRVFDELEKKGTLDNTLVIITSDHGEEMNDNKLNYWGHNGNFTDAQVKVPFIVFGPNFDKDKFNWKSKTVTSHMDLLPTLMKNYLGVSNPITDYSLGADLLGEEVKREWVLSAKYSGYAIITDETILEVKTSGDYIFMDKRNRELKDHPVNYEHIKQALEQMSYFQY